MKNMHGNVVPSREEIAINHHSGDVKNDNSLLGERKNDFFVVFEA
jgi:hypothetical protein